MRNFIIIENDYQLIEAFFERSLEEVDLLDFEKRLKKDIEFARQVELYEYAKEKIVDLYNPSKKPNEKEFKKRLNQLKEKEQSTRSKKLLFTTLSVAATIALLFFFGPSFWSPTIPTEALIAQVDYKALGVNTDQILMNKRRTDVEGIDDEPYQKLLDAYKTKKYSTVIQIANQIGESNMDAIQLIIGISYRKNGQLNKAIPYFEKVNIQRDIALWNLVAIYLEKIPIDKTNARKYLNQIIEEDYNSKVDAKRIYKQLL